jgi:ribosome-associated protein
MSKTKKEAIVPVKDLSSMLAAIAVEGIQEKKGKEIVSLDLRNIKNSVSDVFVICHAESKNQVEAIARSVEEEIFKKTGEDPWHKEGFENAEWILLDYINIVVHIFQQSKRDFYGIERLWADAEIKKYEE